MPEPFSEASTLKRPASASLRVGPVSPHLTAGHTPLTIEESATRDVVHPVNVWGSSNGAWLVVLFCFFPQAAWLDAASALRTPFGSVVQGAKVRGVCRWEVGLGPGRPLRNSQESPLPLAFGWFSDLAAPRAD